MADLSGGEIGAGGQDVHSRAIRLARLSVWDTVGGARLGVALTGGAQIDLDQLRDPAASSKYRYNVARLTPRYLAMPLTLWPSDFIRFAVAMS